MDKKMLAQLFISSMQCRSGLQGCRYWYAGEYSEELASWYQNGATNPMGRGSDRWSCRPYYTPYYTLYIYVGFKILTGKVETPKPWSLQDLAESGRTRGHKRKLQKRYRRTAQRAHSCANRAVDPSLTEVVSSRTPSRTVWTTSGETDSSCAGIISQDRFIPEPVPKQKYQ